MTLDIEMKKGISKLAKVAGAAGVVAQGFMANAFAADPTQWFPTTGTQGSLPEFVRDTLNTVILISAVIAVAVLIYGGILYIIAAGDEGKVEKATKAIMYAIVGLIICFIAVLVVNFVLTQILA